MSWGGLRVRKDGVTTAGIDWKLCYTLNYLSLKTGRKRYLVKMLGYTARSNGKPQTSDVGQGLTSLLTLQENINSRSLTNPSDFLAGSAFTGLTSFRVVTIPLFIRLKLQNVWVQTVWYLTGLSLVQILIILKCRCSILDNFRECGDMFLLPGNFILYSIKAGFDIDYMVHSRSTQWSILNALAFLIAYVAFVGNII